MTLRRHDAAGSSIYTTFPITSPYFTYYGFIWGESGEKSAKNLIFYEIMTSLRNDVLTIRNFFQD